MDLFSWHKLVMKLMSRAARRRRERQSVARVEAAPPRVEVLENRVMPSVTASIVASKVVFTGDGGSDDLLIRVNGGGGLDYSVDHGQTFSNKFGGVN